VTIALPVTVTLPKAVVPTRPVTVTEGTNTLVTFEMDEIKKYVAQIDNGTYKKGTIPKFWDGKSTERILKFISEIN
jgi:UDP-N-acetylglucosamine 2-epimerase (non-hydrolysing)